MRNVIGCAFALEEWALCGEPSHCPTCVLRNFLLKALNDNASTLRKKLHRRFYVGDTPVDKYFHFSVWPISHNDESMVMVVIDDLSELESQRLSLVEKQRPLDEDLSAAAGIQQNLLWSSHEQPGTILTLRIASEPTAPRTDETAESHYDRSEAIS